MTVRLQSLSHDRCDTEAVTWSARLLGWSLLLTGIALAAPQSAWARAGGGGGGGGGFGGGGGAGAPWGAGSGAVLWVVIPMVVVPVLTVFVGPALVNRHVRRRDAAIDRETRAAGLDGSSAAAGLKQRVWQCFFPVQESWKRRDIAASRPYVSDALYERHRLKLEKMMRQNRANRIEGLVLSEIRLASLHRAKDGTAERFTARIEASARDWVTDLRRGVVVKGDPDEDRSFVEYWSFVRHPDFGWVLDEIHKRGWRLP